jgi:glycosyltransferase involved in cell wall biosynthesis
MLTSQNDSSEPLVAVVIPHYNASSTIKGALNSLAEQEYSNFRVVIVDDGSTAPEVEQLERVVSESTLPISLILLEINRGPSGARNAGWDAAEADLIAFLDADDLWYPMKLRKQVDLLRRDDGIALVGCLGGGGADRLRDMAQVLDVPLWKQVLRNHFATSGAVVRGDVKLRFDTNLRYSEDNHLWCRIISDAGRGVVLQEQLYLYGRPAFGFEGPSGKYLRMYGGQMAAFASLLKSGRIGVPLYTLAAVSATLRLIRRAAIRAIRSSNA